MKFEIPCEETKNLWNRTRHDWRFWAFTTAIATAFLLVRCLTTGCRLASPRQKT